jgi:hypothetical protein
MGKVEEGRTALRDIPSGDFGIGVVDTCRSYGAFENGGREL